LNEEMWVKCEICGKGFDNYPALIAHIYKHCLKDEDKRTIIPYEKADITDLAREVSILKVNIHECVEAIDVLVKALDNEHEKLEKLNEKTKIAVKKLHELKSIINDFKSFIKKCWFVIVVLLVINMVILL